jgi:hypothetical protein
MLTAKEARKISQNAGEVDEIEKHAKRCVEGILVGVRKDAGCGYCQHTLDLRDYPKKIRIPIIHKLEDLGYKVRPYTWFSNSIYIISL